MSTDEKHNGEDIILCSEYFMSTLFMGDNHDEVKDVVPNHSVYITTYARNGLKKPWTDEQTIAVSLTELEDMARKYSKFADKHNIKEEYTMDKTIRDIQDSIDNGYSETQPAKYYVTMTDKALSGWGRDEGRINKLIFLCKDMREARIVEDNAQNRTDMKYINICVKFPYYNKGRYYAQVKTIEDYPSWYKPGYF